MKKYEGQHSGTEMNTFMKYISENELLYRIKNVHNLKIRLTDNLNRHFTRDKDGK